MEQSSIENLSRYPRQSTSASSKSPVFTRSQPSSSSIGTETKSTTSPSDGLVFFLFVTAIVFLISCLMKIKMVMKVDESGSVTTEVDYWKALWFSIIVAIIVVFIGYLYRGM